jgi:hypothetical protein
MKKKEEEENELFQLWKFPIELFWNIEAMNFEIISFSTLVLIMETWTQKT